VAVSCQKGSFNPTIYALIVILEVCIMSIGFLNREVFRNDFDNHSRLRAVTSQHSPRLSKACVTRRVRTPEETKAAATKKLKHKTLEILS
jgi:hypothetical protein